MSNPPLNAAVKMKKICHGFTLFEILVATAIIGVLAALLLSAVSGMSNTAKATASTARLKSVAGAILAASVEHYGNIPRAIAWDSPTTPNPRPFQTREVNGKRVYDVHWCEQILPYLSYDEQICPARDKRVAWREPMNWSYGINHIIAPEDKNRPQVRVASIKKPSETYLVMAAGGYTLEPFRVLSPTWIYYLPGAGLEGINGEATRSGPHGLGELISYPDFMGKRFGNKNPVAFVDGHAELVPVARIIAEATAPSPNAWVPEYR